MRWIALLVVLLTVVAGGSTMLLQHSKSAPADSTEIAADEPTPTPRAPQPTPRPAPARSRGASRYDLPAQADVPTLVEFVRSVRDFQPTTTAESEEHAERAPTAIRDACQRILKLETDTRSPDHHFAQRELLSLDIQLLPLVDDGRVRLAAIKRLRDVLLARPRLVEDAELALDLATAAEEFESANDTRQLLEALATYYAASDEPEVQLRAEMLRGAIRRLAIVGQPLEVKGRTVDGREFDLAQWKGKAVVVDFWADWAGENFEEWSNLKRNYLAYHAQGLEVVSICLAESRDELAQWTSRQRVPWELLFDDEAGGYHPLAIELGVFAPPKRLLIDPAGKVAAIDIRGRHLRRHLRKLLGPPKDALGGNRANLAFNSGEVIERLCDAGEELLARGRYTAATSLRPDLAQPTCKLKLPEPAHIEMNDHELFRRVSESVFVVGTLYKGNTSADFDLSLATAFAVTADGVLSTSYHVFDDDPEALVSLVMDSQGQTYPIEEILAANEAADTCLLKVPATGLKPLPFAPDAPPGTKARIVSHPGDSFYFLSSGHVSNYEVDDDGVLWMNVTADFAQGSSGGPVVDTFGNVIGQVSRTATMYAGDPLDPPEEKPHLHGHSPRHHPRRGGLPNSPIIPEVPAWMEPQMIFRTCVPAANVRKLVAGG